MACSKFIGSCSLCPWCGTNDCTYNTEVQSKNYYIYITDRKEQCYDVLSTADTITKVKEILNNIKNGKYDAKFRKKHQYCCTLEEPKIHYKTKNKYYPNSKPYYLPLIEITVTRGEYDWYTAIRLVYNKETKTLDYYDHINSHIKYKGSIKIIKPWDEKVNFKKQ